MTLCPVALAVGCEKCPMFKICPLKTVPGDQKKRKKGRVRRKEITRELKGVDGEIHRGQTTRIMGTERTIIKISSGNPMRQ